MDSPDPRIGLLRTILEGAASLSLSLFFSFSLFPFSRHKWLAAPSLSSWTSDLWGRHNGWLSKQNVGFEIHRYFIHMDTYVSHHNKQYCQENKHTHHRHTDKKTVSFGSSLSSINRVQSFLSFSFFLKSCKGAKKFEKTVKRYLFITFINHCVSVPSFLSHKSFRSCESAKKFLEIFDEQSCVRSKTERTFFNVVRAPTYRNFGSV